MIITIIVAIAAAVESGRGSLRLEEIQRRRIIVDSSADS